MPRASLPSVTSALPERLNRRGRAGAGASPLHSVAMCSSRQSHSHCFIPRAARFTQSWVFLRTINGPTPSFWLEVKGDTSRRVYLSHPLAEERVATSLESGTGLSKTCVTSQAHGLGPLAQNVRRLGILMVGERCIYQTDVWRGVDTDSRPAA